MVKNLQRVDIHENLLCSININLLLIEWSDIFKLGHALPKLTFLQLDYNYLLPLSQSALPTTTTTDIPPPPSTDNDNIEIPIKSIMDGAFNHLTV